MPTLSSSIILVLLFVSGLRATEPTSAPTTGPATRPYAGLTLRDDSSGKVLVSHIAPGPLEGRGFKSPHLFRGDTILSVNGSPMTARQFNELVTRANVGDEVVLEVKRTGSGKVTPVPSAAAEGKVEELRFKLADSMVWVGPVEYRKPSGPSLTEIIGAIDHRVSPTTAPTPLEAFIDQQLAGNNLAQPVDDLLKLLKRTQENDWGFNSLSLIAYGFHQPRKLPRLQKMITDPLPQAAADPRQVLVEAARMIDVEPPSIEDAPDLSDPDKAVAWLAQHLDSARADFDRAFAGMSTEERTALPATMTAILAHIARPATIDSAADANGFIKATQSTMRMDYRAMFGASSHLSGLLALPPLAASQIKPRSPTTLPTELDGAVTGAILAAIKSPSGWIIYGSADPNTYDLSRLAAVIDIGGDDTYRYFGKDRPTVQTVIDLAGNDQYLCESGPGPGAAVMGISLLVDLAGDDLYRGLSISCGAGVLGIGVIVDRGGNDRYEGTNWCEGAGVYGVGAIIDTAGTDIYIAQNHSQAIGGPRGFGLILDAIGDDLYRANGPTKSAYDTPGAYYAMSQGVGFGFRWYDSGGIGIIEDLAGNDRYEAGEFAQGGGYYYGMGILHDRAGNDVYFGNRYSQGFSAHEAIGMLIDEAGDDSYWGMTAANQAAAWDYSIAMLIDKSGNDTYRGDGLAQGSAAMQAIAWLIDLGGTDHYTGAGTAVQGQGAGNEYHQHETGCFSWSLLLDAGGGTDFFNSGRANNTIVKTGSLNAKVELSDLDGLFIDTTEQFSIDAK